DGIRDRNVTGVQTCALPIYVVDLLKHRDRQVEMALQNMSAALRMSMPEIIREYLRTFELRRELENMRSLSLARKLPRWLPMRDRSEERRVGKECRWWMERDQ